MLAILTIHLHCIKEVHEALFLPDRSAFMNWMPHLRISCPATFMIVLEVWAVEVLGVFAGWISINDQAVNSILQCFNSVMFMVPIGAQAAACALIGEQIGANNVKQAREFLKVIVILTVGVIVTIQTLMLVFREEIVNIFTDDKEVREQTISTMVYVVAAFAPDCI